MYQMGSTRCGISAKQIQGETRVTYKTAWRMFKQGRSLMPDGDLQLEGPTVEMDEAYFGGKRKGGTGRPMRGDEVKTPHHRDLERKGRVLAKVGNDVSGASLPQAYLEWLGNMCCQRVRFIPMSSLATTGIKSVQRKDGQGKAGYQHRRINHSSKIYVVGDIHTNPVEGFWSLSNAESAASTTPSARSICRAIWTSTAIGTITAIRAICCSNRFWGSFRSGRWIDGPL